jgi:sialate O-acetylesterase
MIKVLTSWDNIRYFSKPDAQGTWRLNVKTPKAGGPYEITISDGSILKLKDVLIGEVWLCSGQSNMAMMMKGGFNQPVLGSVETIATSSNPNIRLFTVKPALSFSPENDFTGEWMMCTPENIASFSATAFYFGKMLQIVLGVPVGLINSSYGGTRIEPWISENGIKNFDWVSLPEKSNITELTVKVPTVLFNAMIHPVCGYHIRGTIWYQGESNRNEPDKYQKLLPGLVKDWRSVWNIGQFPFYYVQIAPFDYDSWGGVNSAFLREAQLKALDSIPNSGMACILDAGDKNCVHPPNKKVAGERLAYLALAKTYGVSGFTSSGPVLNEMKIEGSIVKLTFKNSDNGLTSFGKELNNFTVAGADKRFFPAHASITREGITLFSSTVVTPVAVRYAFGNYVTGDLFNTEGLPASSFRTDNW